MSSKRTKIQWTDVTDNPIHLEREDGSHGGHWCRKISPACAGCYAEAQNQKGFFSWASKLPYTGQPPESLIFDQGIVDAWAKAKKPLRRFVCSMTDWAGDWVPREWQFAIFDAADRAPTQTIQLCTKRSAIAAQAAYDWCKARGRDRLPSNVWMGVSVGTQAEAEEHVLHWNAMNHIAGLTFVSYEPALEAVDWQGWGFLDWLLIGGESGPNARPFYLEWGHSAIAWCRAHRVSPFMKQLGDNPMWFVNSACDPPSKPPWMLVQYLGVGSFGVTGKGGNPEEWPEYLRVREFPLNPTQVESK